jgi:hypothetical protein
MGDRLTRMRAKQKDRLNGNNLVIIAIYFQENLLTPAAGLDK